MIEQSSFFKKIMRKIRNNFNSITINVNSKRGFDCLLAILKNYEL